jgi:uncharacterized protein
MSAEENTALLKRAFDAFTRGDAETLKELIAEDVVWQVPGRSPVAGTYRGHEELFGYFGKIMELSAGTFHAEIHDTLATEEHIVNLERLTATRGNKQLDVDLILVVHPREGKIAEVWDRFSDQYAWDEFWS